MIPQLDDFFYFLTGRTAPLLSPEANGVLLLSLVLLAAFFCPRRFSKLRRLAYLRPVENVLNRLARRRTLVVAGMGVLALALNSAISLLGRWPVPAAHDEFSYLLAADTFSHWRLTNPTHPLWVHFESFHIILQPSYMSKYPPGEGLMLALGQILFGHPIIGSWIGTALACMAMCWAMQRWLSPQLALLGGLLAVVHPLVLTWTQSFWGCQPALAGGALAVGALSYFDKAHSDKGKVPARAGWIFGIGCALMLITRPYEGLALSGLLSIAIAIRLWKSRPAGASFKFALAPIAFLLLCTTGFWGYYNYRITGSAAKMPYMVHYQTYGVSPLMIWERFRPVPRYNHREMWRFHSQEESPTFTYHRTSAVLWAECWNKIGRLFYLQFQSLALLIGVLTLPWVYARNKKLRPLFWILGCFVAALLLEVWLMPHYVAPALTCAFIISVQGWKRLRLWRWHRRPCGLFLARAAMLLTFLSLITSVAQLVRPDSDGLVYAPNGLRHFGLKRAKVSARLKALPGEDLVLVSYRPNHNLTQEWVFNAADIDDSPIVWARAMTPSKDRVLEKYFPGRKVWRLDADSNPPNLQLIRP